MSIEEKIKEIAGEKFPGFSYVFENWMGADETVARVELPVIICILPVSGSLTLDKGRIRDEESTAIAFVDAVERDANGEDNEKVYTRMKESAGDFIKAMNDSGYFEPIDGKVPYKTIYESMSTNVTGVFVELEVKELIGRCL